jgi:hypothetical protein
VAIEWLGPLLGWLERLSLVKRAGAVLAFGMKDCWPPHTASYSMEVPECAPEFPFVLLSVS